MGRKGHDIRTEQYKVRRRRGEGDEERGKTEAEEKLEHWDQRTSQPAVGEPLRKSEH